MLLFRPCHRSRLRGIGALSVLSALLAAAVPMGPSLAQDAPPPQRTTPNVNTPDLAEPVLKLLEASYLTDDERRDLRIFHGVWREDDLNTPQRRAAASLIRGVYDDPAFADPSVAVEDRA